jgi:valyl-tRNA synthetase
MMMFGLYAMKDRDARRAVPFKVVMLHGLVRDQYGKKMTKSRGNTVDPLEWIDRYGADALRFTLARGANPGSDQAISEEWVAGSRNFGNKLWNATRFALMNGAYVDDEPWLRGELTDADRWILDRLGAVVSTVDALLEDFQFAKASDTLYHFVWDEFCDWYLELAKVQLSGDPANVDSTRAVLGHVLDTLLRMLHPTIPFVTEVLWTALTGGESVTVAPWPTTANRPSTVDRVSAQRMEAVRKLVTEIRRFRSDQGLNPGQRVPARLSNVDGELNGLEQAVRTLVRLDVPDERFRPTVSFEVGLPTGTVSVELDVSGSIDVAAERARLAKDLAAAEKELAGTEAKLANPNFTGKAPPRVVDKIKARRAVALADIERIRARLAALSGR